MEKSQIDMALRKLDVLANFARGRVINDIFVKNEYGNYLSAMTWDNFIDTYRDLQRTCKELPTIAEIDTAYKRVLKAKKGDVKPTGCPLCDGSGWVMFTQIHNGEEYEMYAHCICAAGKQYAYDFRKAEDPRLRENKRVACISEIFDIAQLQAERRQSNAQ